MLPTTSSKLTTPFQRTCRPPNRSPKCPSNPMIFQTAFATVTSTQSISTASTNCTSPSQWFFLFICVYVCIETRAEGPHQVSERSVWVLRKNHVFEEHAACSWGVLELRLGIAALVRTCKWDSHAVGLQVAKLGRWIASGTVGQVDCKWDSWAGRLQVGQLGRWTASGTVGQVDCKWDSSAGG